MKNNDYQSDLALHPGEFLDEVLQEAGMTQAELASRIGRPAQMIDEIIRGKKGITSELAVELAGILKVPAHIWMGLETEYRVAKAKQENTQYNLAESGY